MRFGETEMRGEVEEVVGAVGHRGRQWTKDVEQADKSGVV
jgi:uncharacterized FAD-dependent dehydrogenase